jgi:hypothetical protein
LEPEKGGSPTEEQSPLDKIRRHYRDMMADLAEELVGGVQRLVAKLHGLS